jgi:hypothetical protein
MSDFLGGFSLCGHSGSLEPLFFLALFVEGDDFGGVLVSHRPHHVWPHPHFLYNRNGTFKRALFIGFQRANAGFVRVRGLIFQDELVKYFWKERRCYASSLEEISQSCGRHKIGGVSYKGRIS